MLFWNSRFFDDPTDISNLISDSSAFSKSSLNLWKFTVHVLLKPRLENFGHYFTSMWDECNCAVVWAVFGIAFLWVWNENWHFPVLWPRLSFPNVLACWVQHFHSIIFWDLKSWSLNQQILMISSVHMTLNLQCMSEKMQAAWCSGFKAECAWI